MTPITRKRLTVDVIERRQVSFRIGQSVWWERRAVTGTIRAFEPGGAVVRYFVFNSETRADDLMYAFAPWSELRPRDGRRYA